ncbi:MAG TPA: hypothetical protein PLG08_14785 [Chitinophagaceae bacterium]|nr:hypothetical protein [Chitinophagaceae bacterium]
MNHSIISYDSYYGFIKYKLDEDIENEIKGEVETKKQEEMKEKKIKQACKKQAGMKEKRRITGEC